jgi:hypothetical protein
MKYLVCMRLVGNESWVTIAQFVTASDAMLFWGALLGKDPDRQFEYRMLDGDKVLLEA